MPTVNINAIRNAFVSQEYPTTNFSSADYAYCIVGAAYDPLAVLTVDYPCNTWVGFDLTSIPTTATITSATLSMFQFYQHGDSYSSVFSYLKRVIGGSWDQSTITWNNAPDGNATGTTIDVEDIYGGLNSETLISVTVDIASALSGRAVDWRLSYEDSIRGVNYSSITGYSPPRLDITYETVSANALFFGSD